MVPLRAVFSSASRPALPSGRRGVSELPAPRDVDEVGKTSRRRTFFQMNGNFSLGLLQARRDRHGLEPARLATRTRRLWPPTPRALGHVFYEDDDEAADLWVRRASITADRVVHGPGRQLLAHGRDRRPRRPVQRRSTSTAAPYGPRAARSRRSRPWKSDLVASCSPAARMRSKTDFDIAGEPTQTSTPASTWTASRRSCRAWTTSTRSTRSAGHRRRSRAVGPAVRRAHRTTRRTATPTTCACASSPTTCAARSCSSATGSAPARRRGPPRRYASPGGPLDAPARSTHRPAASLPVSMERSAPYRHHLTDSSGRSAIAYAEDSFPTHSCLARDPRQRGGAAQETRREAASPAMTRHAARTPYGFPMS